MVTDKFWTLSHSGAGGDEQTAEDWGISNLTRRLVNQGGDTATFNIVSQTAVDATPIFPYGSTVIIRRDRTVSPSGEFEGGSQWFYGRVVKTPTRGAAGEEATQYTVAGPWWWLENLNFRQRYRVLKSYDQVTGPVYEIKDTGHVYLNLRTNHPDCTDADGVWVKITTGQQIKDVLAWAISKGAPITLGSEFPNVCEPIQLPNGTPNALNFENITGCPSVDIPISDRDRRTGGIAATDGDQRYAGLRCPARPASRARGRFGVRTHRRVLQLAQDEKP